MKKQHLTLGIALALATSACTGIGVHTGPTVTGQIAEEQGFESLWGEQVAESPKGAVEPHYRNDLELADLWVKGGDHPVPSAEAQPTRAAGLVNRLTPTESVFWSDANTSEVFAQ